MLQQKQEQMLQKLLLKEQFKKTAEATGDLTGNKIADKITSVGKIKSKEKKDETNKRQEIYLPPDTIQQNFDNLRLFQHHIKMEYQKITKLLD